jgi:hypothetical protein
LAGSGSFPERFGGAGRADRCEWRKHSTGPAKLKKVSVKERRERMLAPFSGDLIVYKE